MSEVGDRRECNVTKYTVTSACMKDKTGALVDRGANGGLAGDDVRIITKTDRTVDVSGIDDHQMDDLSVVTAGGVTRTTDGKVIVIMNQYAGVPGGKTIHSSIQLEHFENLVNDKPSKVNKGGQII